MGKTYGKEKIIKALKGRSVNNIKNSFRGVAKFKMNFDGWFK